MCSRLRQNNMIKLSLHSGSAKRNCSLMLAHMLTIVASSIFSMNAEVGHEAEELKFCTQQSTD